MLSSLCCPRYSVDDRNKLKKQEMISKPQSMNNVTVKREELNLENKVYSDKLEDTEDRMARWEIFLTRRT